MMRWRNITASTLSACSRIPQRCRPSSFNKDGHQESCRARKDAERYLFMLGSPNRGRRINLLFPAIVIQVDYVFGDVNGLGSLRKWNPVANVDGWQGAASSNSALPPSGRCDFTITSQATEASYMAGSRLANELGKLCAHVAVAICAERTCLLPQEHISAPLKGGMSIRLLPFVDALR